MAPLVAGERSAVCASRHAAGSRPVVLRGAVSTLSAHVVHGPMRPATVVASTRLGCYLLLDGADVLPVLAADALVLPTALRLPVGSTALDWRLERGAAVTVGGGAVTTPELRIQAVRTVRPARVRRARPDPRRGLDPHIGDRTADLLARLGAGAGLTPEADDELAGHLLVAWALGAPVPDLDAHLERTTALSASLLRAAATGYAVPEVVAYVDAVVGGDAGRALRLRPRVEAIGHTSGPALLRGIDTSHPCVERTPA